MHARARDRADIDDAARGRFELADQPARQHDRREEIDLEHRLPVLQPRAERAEPAAAFAFRRDRRVVDERMQPALLSPEPLLHLDNGADDVVRVGEIDLDVVIGAGLPGTVMRKWVTRAGDHAPASRGEPLPVAWPMPRDAPVRIRTLRSSSDICVMAYRARVTDRDESWSTALAARRAGTRSGHAAGRDRSARTRSRAGSADSRASKPAGPQAPRRGSW